MRVAVLNIVGLSKSLLGANAPGMTAFAEKHGLQTYKPAFPALTTTAQSSSITGTPPDKIGIVSNGWYERESAV
ncbi:MAG: alkaline phosphatase family protein, partial [bacterium]